MAEEVRIKNTGLRGITVADTKISFIDGEKGILIYRGYRIEELAANSNFMETSYLLLNGRLPSPAELTIFSDQVAKYREVPDFIWESMSNWPPSANPMHVLMAAVPMLAMEDPEPGASSRDAVLDRAMRLIAQLPTLTAGWHRIRNCLEPLAPDTSLDHAADFLTHADR